MLRHVDPRPGSADILADAIRSKVRHHVYQIKRILIVDDSKLIAHRIKDFLHHNAGFSVNVATNSDEALALIRRANEDGKPFQLVITDMEMGMRSLTGSELLAEVRTMRPSTKTILMSSIADTALRQFEHADFTLHKDVNDMLADLLLLIDRLETSILRSKLEAHPPLAELPMGKGTTH